MITVHICSQRERAVQDRRRRPGAMNLPLREAQESGGFSVLQRVDESVIDPGIRFDRHSHRDVELLTYVVEGCLEYRDETGQRELVLGGEAQCVHTGDGLTHSEANASHAEDLHLIQATLRLDTAQVQPRYQRRYYSDDARLDKLCLIAATGSDNGALELSSDARVYAAVIRPGEPLLYYRPDNRCAWLQLARGQLLLNDVLLTSGDAATIEGDDDRELRLLAKAESELLLFELP